MFAKIDFNEKVNQACNFAENDPNLFHRVMDWNLFGMIKY